MEGNFFSHTVLWETIAMYHKIYCHYQKLMRKKKKIIFYQPQTIFMSITLKLNQLQNVFIYK